MMLSRSVSRFALVVAVACVSPFTFAENKLSEAIPLPTDNRIGEFPYHKDVVFTLLTRVSAHTHIQLQADEGIVEQPSLGDTIQWRVSGGPTNLYVKPLKDSLVTTMTVVTNKRIYEFELRSSPSNGKFYQKVYFSYPDEESATRLRAKDDAQSFIEQKRKTDEQLISAPTDPTAWNYAYMVDGEAPFRPLSVFDNGRMTFIQLPNVQDMPAVFLKDDKGQLQLVDVQLRGENFLVLPRVADRFVLKINDTVVDVTSAKAKRSWFSRTFTGRQDRP